MADVYEKNLDSKTSLTMNDFIRVVGSDNVSYKQLVSDVADKIITTYAGATLAGSEQSVKDALDGLNSAKQPKTMSQTIGGQTTVEGCLSSLNSKTISVYSIDGKITRTLGSYTSISAPTKDGKTFVCWVSAIPSGWVGSLTISNPSLESTYVYYAAGDVTDGASGNFKAYALYKSV
jgi:hypothetical protein